MQDLNPINFPAKLPLTSRQLGQLKLDLVKSVSSSDLFRLMKRASRFSRSSINAELVPKEWKSFQDAVRHSHEKVQARQKNVPKIRFPDLPVSARSEEIRQLIEGNQVVIIAGETGSGKTTQLPKICLHLGRGIKGLIGHTQPRRLAARSVASRIASELKSPLGDAVGFKIRFADKVSQQTLIKVMTDGILLAETQTDPDLKKYDTIIIDEAHERSLNIDFLLGYLKQLTLRRPDLKIIITSATIDVESFSKHFNNAPIIEVSGRTYPVEIRYRPLEVKDEDDQVEKIEEAILDVVKDFSKAGGRLA